MSTVVNTVFVRESDVAQLCVESIICNQQLLLIVSAGEEPLDCGKTGGILCSKLIEGTVLPVVVGQSLLPGFAYASENLAPLPVPAVLGLAHILGISAEGH